MKSILLEKVVSSFLNQCGDFLIISKICTFLELIEALSTSVPKEMSRIPESCVEPGKPGFP